MLARASGYVRARAAVSSALPRAAASVAAFSTRSNNPGGRWSAVATPRGAHASLSSRDAFIMAALPADPELTPAEVDYLRFTSRLLDASRSSVLAPYHEALMNESNAAKLWDAGRAMESHELPKTTTVAHPAFAFHSRRVHSPRRSWSLRWSSAAAASSSLLTREGLLADSTKRKRARKMNKHKWKKRLKDQRRRSRKDLAQ